MFFFRRKQTDPTADWTRWLHANVWHYALLPDDKRRAIVENVAAMLPTKEWAGGAGLAVTDEMRVTVCGVASLMTLGLGRTFVFPRLRSVILYATGYREPRRGEPGGGILGGILGEGPVDAPVGPPIRDEPFGPGAARLGESWQGGPVVLSWRDTLRSARSRHSSGNLVLHEFAHHLDGLDGSMNGAPTLASREAARRWYEVTESEYHRLVGQARRAEVTLLDAYGATNRAEFFAVATECFFERPRELRQRSAALYGVLGDFYRQDPAAWIPEAPPRKAAAADAQRVHERRRGGRRASWAPALEYEGLGLSESDRRFAEAIRLYDAGEFERAGGELDAVLSQSHEDAEALALRAAVRLEVGDFEGARRDALAASELDPDDARARLTLADALLELGEDVDALRIVRSAVAAGEEEPYASMLAGVLAERRGDHRAARRAYQRVVALDPFDADAYRGLACACEALGDHRAATRALQRAEELDPEGTG